MASGMPAPAVPRSAGRRGQDVGAKHSAMAVAVRGGDDVGDAVLHEEASHRQRLVQGRRPVIDARRMWQCRSSIRDLLVGERDALRVERWSVHCGEEGIDDLSTPYQREALPSP